MKLIAIDTETHLIQPGNLTPKLVCLSYHNGNESGVLLRDEALLQFARWVAEGYVFILHNGVFDLAVLANEDKELFPVIFKLVEDFRVRDTRHREMLFHIRKGDHKKYMGKLSLNHLYQKYYGTSLDKGKDSWRYKYEELENTPIRDWPKAAYDYALNDAIATWDVYGEQEESPDEWLQMRGAWALHLISVHGIITDGEPITKLEKELVDHIASIKDSLLTSQLVRMDKKGKIVKNTKLIRETVERYLGDKVERTKSSKRYPKGQVKIDSNALLRTGDESLYQLIDYSETEKILTTYIPLLKQGTETPINARFNVLVGTGRTSCSKPNLQNQPRKPGVRECYIPRPGFSFVACDYDTLELRALAQVCYDALGYSDMRDALIEGKDLHLLLASSLLNIDYAEAERGKNEGDKKIKDARQFAKIGNFGFAGGLGVEAFVKYAAGVGYSTNEAEATILRNAWFSQWREMRAYFNVASNISSVGSRRVTVPFSGRIRGGVSFTQAANTPFQGTAADGAKLAGFALQWECWVDRESPLYGCRPVVFIHDEYIVEVPTPRVHTAAKRIEEVMNEHMSIVIPSVPITSSAHAMDRWYKDAEAVFNGNGELIPFTKQLT